MTQKSLVLLGATLLLAYPVMAQSSDKLKVLGQLQSGQRVRIQARQLALMEGYFYRFNGDTLYLSSKKGMKPIAVDSMSSLWVIGTSPGEGAMIGGILGAAVAALLVWKTGETDGQQEAVFWILSGAVGGTVLGTLVGLIPSWKQRYP